MFTFKVSVLPPPLLGAPSGAKKIALRAYLAPTIRFIIVYAIDFTAKRSCLALQGYIKNRLQTTVYLIIKKCNNVKQIHDKRTTFIEGAKSIIILFFSQLKSLKIRSSLIYAETFIIEKKTLKFLKMLETLKNLGWEITLINI